MVVCRGVTSVMSEQPWLSVTPWTGRPPKAAVGPGPGGPCRHAYEGLAVLQVGSTGSTTACARATVLTRGQPPACRVAQHSVPARLWRSHAGACDPGGCWVSSGWHGGVVATTHSRFPHAAQVLDDCLSPHDDGDLRTFIEQLFDDWPQQPCDGFAAATSPRPPQQRKQPPQVVLCRVPGCRASITGA